LAAEIKREFGIDSELVASHGGVFEISVDGTLLFSKKSSGRFPDDGEIVRLLRP
jgi:selenoprotein W-related protein